MEAQLVVLACTLLETLEGAEAESSLSLLKSLIKPASSKRLDLLRVAACKMAPCLASHQAELQPVTY